MVTRTERLRACSASCIALSRAFSCARSCAAGRYFLVKALFCLKLLLSLLVHAWTAGALSRLSEALGRGSCTAHGRLTPVCTGMLAKLFLEYRGCAKSLQKAV